MSSSPSKASQRQKSRHSLGGGEQHSSPIHPFPVTSLHSLLHLVPSSTTMSRPLFFSLAPPLTVDPSPPLPPTTMTSAYHVDGLLLQEDDNGHNHGDFSSGFSLSGLHAMLQEHSAMLMQHTSYTLSSGTLGHDNKRRRKACVGGVTNGPSEQHDAAQSGCAAFLPTNGMMWRAVQHLQHLVREQRSASGAGTPAVLSFTMSEASVALGLLQFLSWACLESAALLLAEEGDGSGAVGEWRPQVTTTDMQEGGEGTYRPHVPRQNPHSGRKPILPTTTTNNAASSLSTTGVHANGAAGRSGGSGTESVYGVSGLHAPKRLAPAASQWRKPKLVSPTARRSTNATQYHARTGSSGGAFGNTPPQQTGNTVLLSASSNSSMSGSTAAAERFGGDWRSGATRTATSTPIHHNNSSPAAAAATLGERGEHTHTPDRLTLTPNTRPSRIGKETATGEMAQEEEEEEEEEDRITDAQCAEQLFGLLLSDFLVSLSRATGSDSGAGGPGRLEGVQKQEDEEGQGGHPNDPVSTEVLVAIQFFALVLLAAALVRYEPGTNNLFLSRLFPVEDSPSSSSSFPIRSVRQPVLYPLFHSAVPAVRWAASLALQHALQSLSCFYMAEEIDKKMSGGGRGGGGRGGRGGAAAHNRPLSFMPLSVQSGVFLSQMHECLLWVLRRWPSQIPAAGSDGDAVLVAVLQASTRPIVWQLLATLASVTPYHRCPTAAERVRLILRLPSVYSVLSPNYTRVGGGKKGCSAAPSSTTTAAVVAEREEEEEEQRGAVAVLTQCVRRLSAKMNLSEELLLQHTEAEASNRQKSAPAAAVVPGGYAAALKNAGAPPSGEKKPQSQKNKDCHLVQAVLDNMLATVLPADREKGSSGKGSCARATQSSSSSRRATPWWWYCVTQIGRFYPELFSQQADRAEQLLLISEAQIRVCLTSLTPSCRPTSVTGSGPTAPVLDPLVLSSVSELLRCWTHFMGYVWKPFDGKAEDPALAPRNDSQSPTPRLGSHSNSTTPLHKAGGKGASSHPGRPMLPAHSSSGSNRGRESTAAGDQEAATGGNDEPQRATVAQKCSFFNRALQPLLHALLECVKEEEQQKKARLALLKQQNNDENAAAEKDTDTLHLHPILPPTTASTTLPSCLPPTELVLTTLRCVAQLSDECIMAVVAAGEEEEKQHVDPNAFQHPSRSSSSSSSRVVVEEMVEFVRCCTKDPRAMVRTEALTTVGVWLWSYPSLNKHVVPLMQSALDCFYADDDVDCRTKAALALSNLSARLPEEEVKEQKRITRERKDGEAGTQNQKKKKKNNSNNNNNNHNSSLNREEERNDKNNKTNTALTNEKMETNDSDSRYRLRDQPMLVMSLCEAAAYAAAEDCGTPAIQHHGVRMMRMLLDVLSADDLIQGLEEAPDEVVAEAFVRILNEFVSCARDPKLRWNAALALGVAVRREEVFEAEPAYTSDAILVLCTAVQKDIMFKVRTRAAAALGTVWHKGLRGEYSKHGDYTADVLSALCAALESTPEEDSANGISALSTLHRASPPPPPLGPGRMSSAATLAQGKMELRKALLTSVERVLRSAHPSVALNQVLSKYNAVLQKENLL